MKSVLLSINPKWCELIAQGKKTIEVRKTRPKINTPFKCYIYETKGKIPVSETLDKIVGGEVIGEFVCDKLVWVISHPTIFAGHELLHKAAIKAACMSVDEAQSYSQGKDLYGWHVSDLKIYDEPKKLNEFQRYCDHKEDCCTCKRWDRKKFDCISGITRPPQNWCYVEEENE